MKSVLILCITFCIFWPQRETHSAIILGGPVYVIVYPQNQNLSQELQKYSDGANSSVATNMVIMKALSNTNQRPLFTPSRQKNKTKTTNKSAKHPVSFINDVKGRNATYTFEECLKQPLGKASHGFKCTGTIFTKTVPAQSFIGYGQTKKKARSTAAELAAITLFGATFEDTEDNLLESERIKILCDNSTLKQLH